MLSPWPDMLIEIENLTKQFVRRGNLFRRRAVTAVDGLSLSIERGRTVALVGESGCGKSTVGRLILRLLEPDAGVIRFDGIEIQELTEREMGPFRRHMQIVFQNPLGAMNPAYSVAGTLEDALRLVRSASRSWRRSRVRELLTQVGLGERYLRRRRSEMSGGELQRVSIARALASGPEFLFLDEPTSALDVSVRGQILDLLLNLQEEHGLTYLLVSHDLALVRFAAERIWVMYLGRIMESAPTDLLFSQSRHPYTAALLAAARFHGEGLPALAGEAEPTGEHAGGCRFAARCPYAEERCRKQEPPLFRVGPGHEARCWLVEAG